MWSINDCSVTGKPISSGAIIQLNGTDWIGVYRDTAASGNIYARRFTITYDRGTSPLAPTITSFTDTAASANVVVTWVNNASDETTHEHQYRINKGSWLTTIPDDNTSTTTFDPEDLNTAVDGDNLDYRIRAVKTDHDPSPWVTTYGLIYNIETVPADPTGVVASFSRGLAGVSWTDVATNEDNYECEWDKDGGGWNAFALSPFAANTTFSGLESIGVGSVVTCRVRATNGAGNSNWVSDVA